MTSCMLSWFLFCLYFSSFFCMTHSFHSSCYLFHTYIIIHTHIYDIQYTIYIIMEYLSTYKCIIFYIYIDTHKFEDWKILRYYIQMFSFVEDECRIKIQCISGQKTKVNQTNKSIFNLLFQNFSMLSLYYLGAAFNTRWLLK